MYKRVCIVVLDSVGIGEMPDAADYSDVGAHTLGNVYAACGGIEIPNLLGLGLGNIKNSRLPRVDAPLASYGRMAEATQAKDTTSGHWEMAGLIMHPPFKTFEAFPEDMLAKWLAAAGHGSQWLGNYPSSGTEILGKLGRQHMETGAPIVYTSADSVFQVAAHEEIIPLPQLYNLCEKARELLVGELLVGRVIARPFLGSPGAFTRTKNRRDYAIPPVGPTILSALEEKGIYTLGIGKIEDIFCNSGVKYVNHTTNNADGVAATIDALENDIAAGIIFTNLVDFDMHYGHRNDPLGYGGALEAFDKSLPDIMAALRPDDLLIITADHGCDPTQPSTDHSREYVPLLVYGKGAAVADLGTRATFADVGATVYKLLCGEDWNIGERFMCSE
ncbi:MAG: phosphopentomutase [Defluviitaleaceae bacterium]|nr:phosphopentomutase [Defluviitaleaceae bacterium]